MAYKLRLNIIGEDYWLKLSYYGLLIVKLGSLVSNTEWSIISERNTVCYFEQVL